MVLARVKTLRLVVSTRKVLLGAHLDAISLKRSIRLSKVLLSKAFPFEAVQTEAKIFMGPITIDSLILQARRVASSELRNLDL